ncbi:MAG: hypothetical protein QOF77_1095 [Solirubrobacteraceae bacterium]|jgi:NADH:ubiquinone oxidoreductase subunit F (NADH-binding)|nr:hypothetical protein [Solirubrobacteraceae bacterium]
MSIDGRMLPRLLLGVSPAGTIGLGEHLGLHGELPDPGRGRGGAALIESVERAGLRGRGGAGFPTALKLRAAAAAGGARRRAIVVANGAEGEPASLKDRALTAGAPHLVLDGALVAAEAIGARELIVCLPRSAQASATAMTQAIGERRRDPRRSVATRLELVPDTYLAGQESALVNHLGGGPAIPTLTPPFPTERGIGRRPTLVSNVETLAHLALIARHGSGWFRELGTRAQPGSTLVTLGGDVACPGVYEIAPGSRLEDLLDAAGGALSPIRAFLVGGYSGTWLSSETDVVLSAEQLAPLGATLGAGVIFALAADACPVAESTRIVRWLADESAGQCGPCLHGLEAMATAMEQVAAGEAPPGTGERLSRWQALVAGRGACGHPDGTVRFLRSALGVFAAEFADHAAHGRCADCAQPSSLPFPGGGRRATEKPVLR